MKRFLSVLFSIFLATTVFAGTYTPNLNLYKPSYGESGAVWWKPFVGNMDTLDSAFGAIRPYQGVLDCSTNPNYPAATVGNIWIVSVSGKIGGSSGDTVTIGTMIIANTTNLGGTKAQVGTKFDLISLFNAPWGLTQGGTGGTSAPTARTALEVDYTNSWFNVKNPINGGAVGGYWDAAVATAYAAVPPGGVLFFPPGTFPMVSPLIVLKSMRIIGSGIGQTVLTTTGNIKNIVIGNYNYTGADDWSGSYLVYYVTISDLSLENLGTTIPNSIGLDIRGAAYGFFGPLRIAGPVQGIVINPISSWNKFNTILIHGAQLADGVKVSGAGYSSNYNSTGNIFTDLTVINYSRAAFECDGPVFGDLVVNGLVGYGGIGANAGILLTSTGGKYYANKITFKAVDIDGVGTYGLYANGVTNLKASLVTGGLITNSYTTVASTGTIDDGTGFHVIP